MTGIPLRDRQTEEADVTYAPFVVAMGMLVGAVALTFWPIGVIGALLMIFAGIGLWIRESVLENRRLVPPEVARGHPHGTGLRIPSIYWWGGAGFAFVQWIALGAALRVGSAHGLLDPTLPDAPVTMWVGHATTAVAGVSAALGVWAVRAGATGDCDRLTPSVGLFLASGVVHVALVGLQLVHFTDGPFLEDHPGARAAAGWIFSLHAAFAVGAVVALAVILVRLLVHPLLPQRWGAIQALVLFWWSMLVSWVVLYAAFYLKVIRVSAHLI